MIAYVTKGESFRVSWSLLTLDWHRFKNFSMHIVRSEIGQPTRPFIKIWLIIFGFT
jgi:hypothetical protein